MKTTVFLRNNENDSLSKQQWKQQFKKVEFFLCNKRKIVVKATKHQNLALPKVLLRKF